MKTIIIGLVGFAVLTVCPGCGGSQDCTPNAKTICKDGATRAAAETGEVTGTTRREM